MIKLIIYLWWDEFMCWLVASHYKFLWGPLMHYVENQKIFSLLPEQAKTDRINTRISTKSVFIFSFCFLITSDFSMNSYIFNVMLGNGWVVSSCSVYLKLLPCHFICLQPVFCLHPRVRHSTFVPSHTGNTFERVLGKPSPQNWKFFYFLSHRHK